MSKTKEEELPNRKHHNIVGEWCMDCVNEGKKQTLEAVKKIIDDEIKEEELAEKNDVCRYWSIVEELKLVRIKLASLDKQEKKT